MKFNKKSFILEIRFSRKPRYEGLRGIFMLILGICMADNLQPSNFYQKSDLTVGDVPSLEFALNISLKRYIFMQKRLIS